MQKLYYNIEVNPNKPKIKITTDNKSFTVHMLDVSSYNPQVSGQKIKIENIWDNADIYYRLYPNKIKETIVVKSKPKYDRFCFKFQTSDLGIQHINTRMYMVSDGDSCVYSPPLVVVDKDGREIKNAVTTDFNSDTGIYTIVLSSNIKDADYPIRIDPSFYVSSPVQPIPSPPSYVGGISNGELILVGNAGTNLSDGDVSKYSKSDIVTFKRGCNVAIKDINGLSDVKRIKIISGSKISNRDKGSNFRVPGVPRDDPDVIGIVLDPSYTSLIVQKANRDGIEGPTEQQFSLIFEDKKTHNVIWELLDPDGNLVDFESGDQYGRLSDDGLYVAPWLLPTEYTTPATSDAVTIRVRPAPGEDDNLQSQATASVGLYDSDTIFNLDEKDLININAVFVDVNADIWIGTSNNGIIVYNSMKNDLSRIISTTTGSSLIDVSINSITRRDANYLWIGTDDGMYRVSFPVLRTGNASAVPGLPELVGTGEYDVGDETTSNITQVFTDYHYWMLGAEGDETESTSSGGASALSISAVTSSATSDTATDDTSSSTTAVSSSSSSSVSADTVTIAGNISTPDGEPVSGITVVVSPGGASAASGVTDSDGNYEITFDYDAPSGVETVTPASSSYTFVPSSSAQNVTAGATNTVNFLAWPKNITISGTVVDGNNGDTGLAGVDLNIWAGTPSQVVATTTTATNGTYSIELDPLGGFTGALIPSKGESSFNPSQILYSSISSSQTDQNFSAHVDTIPNVTNGTILPNSGDTNDEFVFQVDYIDEDGDTPKTKVVKIGKSTDSYETYVSYNMTLKEGESSDGTYTYTSPIDSLASGTYSYYFSFEDQDNNVVTYPATMLYSPLPSFTIIEANTAPSIWAPSVDIQNKTSLDVLNGTTNTTFIFTVRYSDVEDDAADKAPSSAKLFVGGNSYDLSVDNIATTVLSTFTQYTYIGKLLPVSGAQWRFEITDNGNILGTDKLKAISIGSGTITVTESSALSVTVQGNTPTIATTAVDFSARISSSYGTPVVTSAKVSVTSPSFGSTDISMTEGATGLWTSDSSWTATSSETISYIYTFKGSVSETPFTRTASGNYDVDIDDIVITTDDPTPPPPSITGIDDDAPVLSNYSLTSEPDGTSDTSTNFIFRINYFDSDGGGANADYVKIHNAGSASETMTRIGSLSTYKLETLLVAGTYNQMYITASDGTNDVRYPADETKYLASLTVEEVTSPTLSLGTVDPASGSTATSYKYSVRYFDPDSGTPDYVNVSIDGADGVAMALESGDAYNGTYTYATTSLIKGEHNYSFEARHAVGPAGYIRLPESESYNGPTVGSTTTSQTSTLTNPSLSPETGESTRTFTYEVHYKDTNPAAPTLSYVYIDGIAYTMDVVGDQSVYDGIYRYQKVTLGLGPHTYYFEFTDANGFTVITSTFTGPTVTGTTSYEDSVCWIGTDEGLFITNSAGMVDNLIRTAVDYFEGMRIIDIMPFVHQSQSSNIYVESVVDFRVCVTYKDETEDKYYLAYQKGTTDAILNDDLAEASAFSIVEIDNSTFSSVTGEDDVVQCVQNWGLQVLSENTDEALPLQCRMYWPYVNDVTIDVPYADTDIITRVATGKNALPTSQEFSASKPVSRITAKDVYPIYNGPLTGTYTLNDDDDILIAINFGDADDDEAKRDLLISRITTDSWYARSLDDDTSLDAHYYPNVYIGFGGNKEYLLKPDNISASITDDDSVIITGLQTMPAVDGTFYIIDRINANSDVIDFRNPNITSQLGQGGDGASVVLFHTSVAGDWQLYNTMNRMDEEDKGMYHTYKSPYVEPTYIEKDMNYVYTLFRARLVIKSDGTFKGLNATLHSSNIIKPSYSTGVIYGVFSPILVSTREGLHGVDIYSDNGAADGNIVVQKLSDNPVARSVSLNSSIISQYSRCVNQGHTHSIGIGAINGYVSTKGTAQTTKIDFLNKTTSIYNMDNVWTIIFSSSVLSCDGVVYGGAGQQYYKIKGFEFSLEDHILKNIWTKCWFASTIASSEQNAVPLGGRLIRGVDGNTLLVNAYDFTSNGLLAPPTFSSGGLSAIVVNAWSNQLATLITDQNNANWFTLGTGDDSFTIIPPTLADTIDGLDDFDYGDDDGEDDIDDTNVDTPGKTSKLIVNNMALFPDNARQNVVAEIIKTNGTRAQVSSSIILQSTIGLELGNNSMFVTDVTVTNDTGATEKQILLPFTFNTYSEYSLSKINACPVRLVNSSDYVNYFSSTNNSFDDINVDTVDSGRFKRHTGQMNVASVWKLTNGSNPFSMSQKVTLQLKAISNYVVDSTGEVTSVSEVDNISQLRISEFSSNITYINSDDFVVKTDSVVNENDDGSLVVGTNSPNFHTLLKSVSRVEVNLSSIVFDGNITSLSVSMLDPHGSIASINGTTPAQNVGRWDNAAFVPNINNISKRYYVRSSGWDNGLWHLSFNGDITNKLKEWDSPFIGLFVPTHAAVYNTTGALSSNYRLTASGVYDGGTTDIFGSIDETYVLFDGFEADVSSFGSNKAVIVFKDENHDDFRLDKDLSITVSDDVVVSNLLSDITPPVVEVEAFRRYANTTQDDGTVKISFNTPFKYDYASNVYMFSPDEVSNNTFSSSFTVNFRIKSDKELESVSIEVYDTSFETENIFDTIVAESISDDNKTFKASYTIYGSTHTDVVAGTRDVTPTNLVIVARAIDAFGNETVTQT